LTEPDFRKIIASLWAFVGWTNKDYVADRVLTYKDVKELRSELKELLYGKPHSRSAMTFQALIGILQSGVQRSLGRASGRVSSPYRFFNLFSARGILPPRHRFQTLIGILQSRKRSCTVWRRADVSSPYRYSSNKEGNSSDLRLSRRFQALIGILQTRTKSAIFRSFVRIMRVSFVHHRFCQ
jgi:hypothetical protein